MICRRCSGLVVIQKNAEGPDEFRCVNCGDYPSIVLSNRFEGKPPMDPPAELPLGKKRPALSEKARAAISRAKRKRDAEKKATKKKPQEQPAMNESSEKDNHQTSLSIDEILELLDAQIAELQLRREVIMSAKKIMDKVTDDLRTGNLKTFSMSDSKLEGVVRDNGSSEKAKQL